MNKEIKAMTNKELKETWRSIDNQINFSSFGMFELRYRMALEEEFDNRGIEI